MKKRLLGVLMLAFLIGGGSLFTLAEDISFPTTPVDLGGGVKATWDATEKTLNIEGNGKIDKNKWISFKVNNKLTTDAVKNVKISFGEKVQFPDDASSFFQDFKTANIVFHPNMDTSNVTSMNYMFAGARNFNQPIGNWNTSNVKEMGQMFLNAKSFNQDLSRWDVSNVKNMYGMFNGAGKFNGNISNWNTSSVTTMKDMFQRATNFNQPIGNWNTEKVANMYGMFYGATGFNQPIGNWNTSSVTTMKYMFAGARSFDQPIAGWDTSKVTDMYGMFHGARKFNQPIGSWNVEKVTTMAAIFLNAFSFDQDISGWDPKSLNQGANFIASDDSAKSLSFSRENYEKLLTGWNEKLKTNKPNFILTIEAPYCFEKEARESLKTKGYNIYGDRRDCELEPELEYQTGSRTTISNTLTIGSLLPADQIKARIVATESTASYSNWQCSVENALSPGKIKCTFDVTSTENGQDIKLEITDGVEIITDTTQYLVDGEGPELPQVHIDSSDMNKPKITLPQFPVDRGRAGVKSCSLSYKNKNGDDSQVALNPGNENGVVLSDLKELSYDHKIHIVKVQCVDELGNLGDVNEIKFPPIIEFSSENKTLIKKDTEFGGTFTIYSPNGNIIDAMEITNANDLGITSIKCQGTIDPTQSKEFSNELGWEELKGLGMKNDINNKIICEYKGKLKTSGKLAIEVWDDHGAEGKNSQSFSIDDKAPEISIKPEQFSSSGDITLTITITITDDHKLNPETITIGEEQLDLNTCTTKTDNKLVCTHTITAPSDPELVKKQTIKITAQDSAGNEVIKESKEFTIDRGAPSIDASVSYELSGTVAKASFTVKDNEGGVGLRTQADENVEGFDNNVLSYFFSEKNDCSNPEDNSPLIPGTTAFEITDSTKNGKYLCLQVRDKVGNLTSKSLGQININIAPVLDPISKTIAQTTPKDTRLLKLPDNDNQGDGLSYEITKGNDNGAFAIQGNELILKKVVAAGTYTLTMKVTDARGLSSEVQATITVDPAPTFEKFPIKEVSTRRGRSLDTITFTVNDNDKVKEVKIDGLPDGVTAKVEPDSTDAKEKKVTISGIPTVKGNYKVTVSADDEIGNLITREFTIVVRVKASQNDSSSIGTFYDNCPNGDHSGSRTDGRCDAPQSQVNTGKNQTLTTGDQTLSLTGKVEQPSDTKPELVDGKTKYQDTVIFNPTIENGKCYTRRAYLGIKDSEKIVTSEEFKKALSFLRSYEMTMFDSVEGFDPYRNLSREEAAKIFSNFAMHVLCRKPDMNLSVHYSDVENADPSLKPYITLAYQLGVMKGSGMGDGEFRPFDAISKAEVNAVLIRMILKSYLDEKQSENKMWYSEYNKVATDLGIINQGAGAEPVLRNNVALMLFRAYKNQVFDWRNINYFSYVLNSRDLFVR